ncbi:MAG: 2Fe-2S iron-sulfur cluster binding domain-containing protein [Clostridia bacterium]|nr:2Fe-2S iron-sulfur cluster binding domain-containing protein [Clostridia bacterium]
MASPIKSLDFKRFLPMLKDRQANFAAARADLPAGSDQARVIAKALHPKRQYLKVAAVTERAADCKSFTLVPDPERGTEALAYFGAGKYLTVFETIGGLPVTRAYSISSAPKDALAGRYELTVKRVDGGLMSQYILNNWAVGTPVEVSAPSGNFEYQPLRDAETVVCLAGGSGITPFLSMANAIADGDEDFNMVLLYGSRSKENILFYDELDALTKRTDRVKVVHVLSDEGAANDLPGAEAGFLTAALIQKYAPANAPYSVFLCGPQQMYAFVDKELEQLNLPRKYVRHEMFGEFHDPASQDDYPADVPATVKLTVTVQDETTTVTGSSSDSVMQILEKNGIAVPSRCRSGECGFCHSHLLSGKVYVPKHLEYRRLADAQFGCIHPCCSFPLTDLVLNVPPAK